MKFRFQRACLLGVALAAGILPACSTAAKEPAHATWNAKAAAAYLDQREVSWMAWPGAARDHDTFCVSCHTVLPYALARPALRKAAGDQGPAADERKLLDNVSKRVRLWSEVGPYYSGGGGYDDAKPAESRGTEAVINALILANADAETGKLSDITRTAFANMWAQQLSDGERKGSWPWLQFGMEPWEAQDSQYYGAALAALAVGTAPENYRSTPDIQPKLSLLRDYLNREFEKQSTINHVALLWASVRVPGLIDADRQKAIIREVSEAQQSDGGWRLPPLAWQNNWGAHSIIRKRLRSDWSHQETQSDGYATGLITFVLPQAGISADDPRVRRGLSWLESHQTTSDGSWPSVSLTQRRDPESNTGHFMRDAATAYAVLALSENGVAPASDAAGDSRSSESQAAITLAPH